MQSSIFDIFGEESRNLPSRQQTPRQSSSSHILKGFGTENVRGKPISVTDLPSKNALGDIGNSQKKSKALQDKSKVPVLAFNDQENATSNILAKTPLQKAKLSFQTPTIRPAVRSPLSDLLPKPRPLVPVFQQPDQVMKARNSKSEKIEDFINNDDDDDDSSHWVQDEFFPEEDDTDILARSERRPDAEIYRLVNFWEIPREPFDFESDEDVAVQYSPDFLFESTSPFDIFLEEPFSVPVVSDDF